MQIVSLFHSSFQLIFFSSSLSLSTPTAFHCSFVLDTDPLTLSFLWIPVLSLSWDHIPSPSSLFAQIISPSSAPLSIFPFSSPSPALSLSLSLIFSLSVVAVSVRESI